MTEPREEELADQLRSLDDLDAEHEVGDLDDADYRALRDDYTVRVADTVRRLEQPDGEQDDAPQSGSSRRRRLVLAAVAGLAVFAVAAGWLLARSAGERGVNDSLTGGIDSNRQRILDCQDLANEGQVLESLQCLDAILAEEPDNVEALTYRGWFVVLTAESAEAAGEGELRAELLDTGLAYLDQAVAIDDSFPDARVFRAVVYDRQGERAAVCHEIAALIVLDPPPFFVDQTSAIAERNSCGGP